MRIRKYGFDYGRRALMEKVARGGGAAGGRGSLWPMIGNGADIARRRMPACAARRSR